MPRQFYLKKFGCFSEKPYLCTAFRKRRGVAQLVAHLVWDQVVARSSRVTPTKKKKRDKSFAVSKKRYTFAAQNKNGALDEWLSLWSAKPATAVRIRQAPPKRRFFNLLFFVLVTWKLYVASLTVLLLPHPRQPVPQRFKRTLLVCLEPPFAEVQLQGEYAESDEQTEGCATMGSQIQPQGEEQQSADDRLGNIIRKTHPAVRAQARSHTP